MFENKENVQKIDPSFLLRLAKFSKMSQNNNAYFNPGEEPCKRVKKEKREGKKSNSLI